VNSNGPSEPNSVGSAASQQDVNVENKKATGPKTGDHGSWEKPLAGRSRSKRRREDEAVDPAPHPFSLLAQVRWPDKLAGAENQGLPPLPGTMEAMGQELIEPPEGIIGAAARDPAVELEDVSKNNSRLLTDDADAKDLSDVLARAGNLVADISTIHSEVDIPAGKTNQERLTELCNLVQKMVTRIDLDVRQPEFTVALNIPMFARTRLKIRKSGDDVEIDCLSGDAAEVQWFGANGDDLARRLTASLKRNVALRVVDEY
jgi:hypothetical protein